RLDRLAGQDVVAVAELGGTAVGEPDPHDLFALAALAAQDAVALPQLAVDLGPAVEVGAVEAPRLREVLDRVVPHDLGDLGLGEAAAAHLAVGARDLERIAALPVARAVDDHPLEPPPLHH